MDTVKAIHISRIREGEMGIEAEFRLLSCVTPYSFNDLMKMRTNEIAKMRKQLEEQLESWGKCTPKGDHMVYTFGNDFELEAVSVRYPTGEDLAVSRIRTEYGKNRTIIGRLTGLSASQIDDMPIGDFQAISAWILNQAMFEEDDMYEEYADTC